MTSASDRRPIGFLITIGVLGCVAALLGVLASVSFVAAGNVNRPLPQPLNVTACTPETYPPELTDGTVGPPQSDCRRWFDGNSAAWDGADPFLVTGQVCVDHDEPIAYDLEVAWESLTTQSRFVVIDTPLDWGPGCEDSYAFEYDVPRAMAAQLPAGESLGRWRLVGRAVPVEQTRWATYQWDVTGSASLIAVGRSISADS